LFPPTCQDLTLSGIDRAPPIRTPFSKYTHYAAFDDCSIARSGGNPLGDSEGFAVGGHVAVAGGGQHIADLEFVVRDTGSETLRSPLSTQPKSGAVAL
jgi:hypothetical protein